ncbi:MAG: PorT family protein [Bacteroidales bacterium]|nr:PorT family protein [Bacteroidales bacterium]
MKKILLLAAAALLFAANASAQLASGIHYGVVGGFTSTNTKLKEFDAKNVNLYHVGATVKFNLGLGFAIQPSLTYQVKGTNLQQVVSSTEEARAAVTALDAKVGYLELPVQIQWGPDLMMIRPYAFVEPFIGCGVNFNAISSYDIGNVTEIETQTLVNDFKKAALKRFEYGMGFGGGLEIWRFQVSAEWFMNFGGLADEEGNIQEASVIGENVVNTLKSKNFRGFKVSLAVLF